MLFLHAFRTDAMAELGRGMLTDEFFQPVPVSLVVTDFLAVHADWNDAAQGLYLAVCLNFFPANKC